MHLGHLIWFFAFVGFAIASSSTDDVQALKSLIHTMQTQIEGLTSRLQNLENQECPCDLTFLEDQIRYNAEDITNTKVEVGVLTSIVQTVEVDMHNLKQTVNENQNNILQNDFEVQSLNKRLDTFYNEIEGLKVNVGNLNINANQSNNAIQQTKGELQVVENQLNETIQWVQDVSETIPYTVAFSAVLYNDIGVDRVDVTGNITYNQLILNEGEAFDTETGMFTTKIPGTYFMTFDLPRYTKRYVDIAILKNGKQETLVQSYEDGGYTNMHWSWMVELDVNDQVNLAVTQQQLFVTDFQKVVFNGFLIKQK